MATPITLNSANDSIRFSQGPNYSINGGASTRWNNQIIDTAGGFDTLYVNEPTTKTSYFTFNLAHDSTVTFTAASGSNSPTVSFKNLEKIVFWDVTMLLGTAGNDTVTGTTSSESLYGFDGNDTLSGGTGTNKLYGGAGDDTYVVTLGTDIVSELTGEGNDTVQASISYSLVDTDGTGANGGNVENLVLTGTAISGTGNDLDNKITGNASANILSGGVGNDTLDGAAGNDTMTGGAGNDIYIVDSSSDKATELAGEGKDTVQSSASFVLGDNVENLVLTGSGAIDGTGNKLANVITGNTGNNILTGGAGKDTMTGKAGADTFDFNSIKDSTPGAKHDLIKDFAQGTDHIDLAGIDADAVAGGNSAFIFLATEGAAFTGTPAVPHPGELRFFFSGGSTMVEGDVTGDGVADFSFELVGNISLLGTDFVL